MRKYLPWSLMLALALLPAVALAAGKAPWGTAEVLNVDYAPHKVIYDVDSGDKVALESILDRVSYLNTLYNADPFEASIVIIVHGEAIRFFGIKDFARYKDTMERAQSLTVGGTIEFRMCAAAARLLGYEASDIHGFVKMVPMADAEIVRLQLEEGYAYMR